VVWCVVVWCGVGWGVWRIQSGREEKGRGREGKRKAVRGWVWVGVGWLFWNILFGGGVGILAHHLSNPFIEFTTFVFLVSCLYHSC